MIVSNNIELYLEPCEIIDFDTSQEIAELSQEIAAKSTDEVDFVKNAFEYVRDEISHSGDINGSIVTCRASDVLRERQGVCYAKSHLLAAILRCRGIPAGFCYQLLVLDDELAPELILHGLNAAYVGGKWVRLDARGNKPGVNAQFSLNREQLAFPVRPEKGEEDIPLNFVKPDANVVRALTSHKNIETLWHNLPTELQKRFAATQP